MTYPTLPPYRRSRSLFAAFAAAGAAFAGTALAQEPTTDQGEDVITLPEFAVSTAVDTGYMATNTTSGTRVATEIINLPYSIQVLTEDFFKDFNLYDLDEMVPYVSNLAAGDPAAGGGGGTRLRGFFVPYFRNGFYRRQAPDSNSIARVEVVKGPQSAIYGRVSPGGVINFISKKPQTRFRTGLTQSFGSYDYSRTDAYVTGPLVANKLYYRLDAAYYDVNRPTDYWYNRTTNISGGLTWKLAPETSLTFEYEYTGRIMNDPQTFMRWIGPDGLIQATVHDIPDQRLADRLLAFNSSGAHRRTERINDSYYLQFEHRFDSELSLRANVGYSTRDFERLTPSTLTTWDVRNNRFSNALGTARTGRSMSYQTIDDEQYGAQIDLTKLWRGEIKQRSLFTFDVFQDNTEQETWGLTGTALNNALSALGMTTTEQQDAWKYPDFFDPGYGYQPNPQFHGVPGWTRTGTEAANTFGIERFYYGALFNHTAEFLHGRLAFTGSVRQDWAEFTRRQPYAITPTLMDAKGSAEELTYSGGVNYHVIPRKLVSFVSYGTAFDPAPQTDPNTGDVLGNKTAKGVELGVKGILLDNTFSYTLAAYRVQQENEVTDNPEWLEADGDTRPTLPRYVPGGSTRGEGVSLDLSGRIGSNLTLLGNIAWTDIWVHENKGDPTLVGTKPLGGQNGPTRSAAIAARYDVKSGAFKGLRFGLTYQHYTRYLRFAATNATASSLPTTTFYLPEKNEVSAMIGYSHRPQKKVTVSYTLNVMNLFEEEEITVAAYSPLGREVRFSMGLQF